MGFLKKKYKIIGEVSHKYRHRVSEQEGIKAKICSNCGKKISVKSYFCPLCKRYYCIKCSIQTLGGSVCPTCKGLNFLQVVDFM